ncbi:unnamed protein product [Vitrella brassicaformis CCMP3155]|uniref:Uncharacterized protein n=1 Tax=Vitrella brassicaformis (strain CCMP3155) TaxID=1169540 RepID=A0A0G4GRC6_VITBC|nr:unnamed protein product [Vitrella brassicaformis CCMP3155]|eukprot:CEM33091.1 unnamed protein product [Vitrella brassicaformis CCMP3155]
MENDRQVERSRRDEEQAASAAAASTASAGGGGGVSERERNSKSQTRRASLASSWPPSPSICWSVCPTRRGSRRPPASIASSSAPSTERSGRCGSECP